MSSEPRSPLLLKALFETQRHLFSGTFQVRTEVSSTASHLPHTAQHLPRHCHEEQMRHCIHGE